MHGRHEKRVFAAVRPGCADRSRARICEDPDVHPRVGTGHESARCWMALGSGDQWWQLGSSQPPPIRPEPDGEEAALGKDAVVESQNGEHRVDARALLMTTWNRFNRPQAPQLPPLRLHRPEAMRNSGWSWKTYFDDRPGWKQAVERAAQGAVPSSPACSPAPASPSCRDAYSALQKSGSPAASV